MLIVALEEDHVEFGHFFDDFLELPVVGGCQRKGEQPPKASRTKAKKKAVKPLADRSATIYMRDAFPARIAI